MKKLLKLIDDFFNPPFTVQDIRTCKIRCNLSFITTQHDWVKKDKYQYDYPSITWGTVKTIQGFYLHVSWDNKGRCMVEGIRVKSFDLVRHDQKERDALNIIFIVGCFALLLFFSYVAYKMLF